MLLQEAEALWGNVRNFGVTLQPSENGLKVFAGLGVSRHLKAGFLGTSIRFNRVLLRGDKKVAQGFTVFIAGCSNDLSVRAIALGHRYKSATTTN